MSRQNLLKDQKPDFETERNCSSSNSWRGFPLNKSSFAAASDSSINRIHTPTGLVTPPERIKSKLSFGSIGHISRRDRKQNNCRSFEPLKPHLPPKCRSNDSINQVITPNGIITPPPRKYFNRSTLSLQNCSNKDKKIPGKVKCVFNKHKDNSINQTLDASFKELQEKLLYADTESNEELITDRQPRVSLFN